MPPYKRRARTQARGVRGRFVVVRGVRAQPARTPTGQWVSPPEEILWATYQAASGRWPALRGLTRQVPVLGYKLDFGIAAKRVGIEVDGLAFHGGQAAWQKDHLRQRRLEAAGWRLTRYTAREAAEQPIAVLDEVNRLWGRR